MTEARVCLACGRVVAIGNWCQRCRNRRHHRTVVEGRPLCVVTGCDNIAKTAQRTLCQKHYVPTVSLHAEVGPLPSLCWCVDGARRYGRVRYEGQIVMTHRWAWEREHGPVPDGLHVLHRCDNPPCINVEHLFLGTSADNNADKSAKGRQARGDRCGNAKVTEEDVRAIRLLRSSGERLSALAARYGISETQVSDIARRKSWAHVE